MTITLNDEQARLLSEVVEAGAARSPEHAVDQSVRALHSSTTGKRPVHQQVDNLADLFAKSPFHGLDMDFERDKDTGTSLCERRRATGAPFLQTRSTMKSCPGRGAEINLTPPPGLCNTTP